METWVGISLPPRTPSQIVNRLAALIEQAEDQDVDLIAFPEWHPHLPALTAKFCDFMRRHVAG